MSLEGALARVAVGRLLVASDFDGTLAEITDHPDSTVGDPRALAALRRLARLPTVEVAIVSGRKIDELERLAGAVEEAVLIGEHGNVRSGVSTAVSPELEELAARVREVVGDLPGAVIEVKTHSVGFHYRTVEGEPVAMLERIREWCAGRPGLRVTEARKLLEVSVADRDKGDAIADLREEMDADAVVFVGDDTTDEDVFRILEPDDVGVKVGPGPTAARYRVADVSAVADLLERLGSLVRETHQSH